MLGIPSFLDQYLNGFALGVYDQRNLNLSDHVDQEQTSRLKSLHYDLEKYFFLI